MGDYRTSISLQRHLAAGDRYRHHRRHFFDGVPHSGNAKPRQALQIKLSELILALEGARNELAAVEKQSGKALESIAEEIHERANASPGSDIRWLNRPAIRFDAPLLSKLHRKEADDTDGNRPLPANMAAGLHGDP